MDTFLRYFGPTIKSFIICERPGSKNFQFIINLDLQGHLDDYLRYINASDVLGDCLNKCSCLFVCLFVL